MIVIPKPVYDELSYPTTPHLKQRVDYLINNKLVDLVTIDVDSDTYVLYQELTTSPNNGHKIIGQGEAASIALAKVNNGIVASNNLKDISFYINKFELKHITTGDILIKALEKGYITEDGGNKIWLSMLAKRRKLGTVSFSEYMKSKEINLY